MSRLLYVVWMQLDVNLRVVLGVVSVYDERQRGFGSANQ